MAKRLKFSMLLSSLCSALSRLCSALLSRLVCPPPHHCLPLPHVSTAASAGATAATAAVHPRAAAAAAAAAVPTPRRRARPLLRPLTAAVAASLHLLLLGQPLRALLVSLLHL
jgi:hypothetical protein